MSRDWAAGIGRPDAAPSGPAMMTSDNTYVELSNTPPLASASHHGSGGAAAPDTAAHDHFESSAVATSAANQYLRSAAALRVGSGLQAEQRAPVRAAPPPPPPPPALATSSGALQPPRQITGWFCVCFCVALPYLNQPI